MQDIADSLSLSFTAVCKIINGDPKYPVPKETRDLVFKRAKEMRYDVSRLYTRYRREYERKKVNIPTKVIIKCKRTNKVYNSGTAIIKNISRGGVLISNLKLLRNCLPINPFVCEIKVIKGVLKGCNIIGAPARITNNDGMNLGIRFGYISSECKEKIMSIVS